MSSYATVADFLKWGLPQESWQNMSNAQVQALLDGTSTSVDAYLRGRYALPLISFDTDITRYVCHIAAADLLEQRGYNPEAGADSIYATRRDAATKWFEGVQRQAIHPNVTPSPTGDPTLTFPQVDTACERGWGAGEGHRGGGGVW